MLGVEAVGSAVTKKSIMLDVYHHLLPNEEDAAVDLFEVAMAPTTEAEVIQIGEAV